MLPRSAHHENDTYVCRTPTCAGVPPWRGSTGTTRRAHCRPPTYERQVARVSEELAGAEAEAQHLSARAAELSALHSGLDAETEALRRLAELRRAVATTVGGATDDVGALRAAWAAVFDTTYLMTRAEYGRCIEEEDEPARWACDLAADLGPDLVLVPGVRLEMVADPDQV